MTKFTKLGDDRAKLLGLLQAHMREHGITSATLQFAGAGDEGNLWEVEFEGASQQARYTDVAIPDGAFDDEDYEGHSFAYLIEKFMEDLVDSYCYDWVNGEGGGGSVEITQDKVTIEHYYNESVSAEPILFSADPTAFEAEAAAAEAQNQALIDAALNQAAEDIGSGDFTSLQELFKSLPIDKLRGFISEERLNEIERGRSEMFAVKKMVDENLPKGAVCVDDVKDWPLWVVYSEGDPEENFQLFPFGSMFGNLDRHRFGGFEDESVFEMPDIGDVIQSDEQRLSMLVVQATHVLAPRADRYGVPDAGLSQLAHQWAIDDWGWGYLSSKDGQPKVDANFEDSGDDTPVRIWVEARVHPDVHGIFIESQAQHQSQSNISVSDMRQKG